MTRALPDLIDACRRGEAAAVDELVVRFRGDGLRLARAWLGERALAEDAVQEAFVVALGRLDELRSPQAFAGWWRQLVRTQCNRVQRRQRRTHLELDAAPQLVSDAPSPAQTLAETELRERVRAALDGLEGVGRQTAQLFYLEERSCAEIASALGVPTGTVKRRLHDARERLRQALHGFRPADEGGDGGGGWPL